MGHQHGAAPHARSGLADDPEATLTLITALGLGVALLHAFVVPLPDAVVRIALVLAYLAGGLPAGVRAVTALLGRGRLDIDLLMVIAALAAAAVGAALEGAVLLLLFSLSGLLEHRAMGKARRAVEALMALRPQTAFRITAGQVTGAGQVLEVAVADLVAGERVVLRPGARVPVDGRIVEGEGDVDESTITGESRITRGSSACSSTRS